MRTSNRSVAASFALLLLVSVAGFAAADPITEGQRLYTGYCQVCHGEKALGHGPMARDLVVQPTNLTLISRNNNGVFPADKVYRTIDGRERVRGHGASRMPVWGLGFQQMDQDTNQEAEVREKILQLVRYLQSIQEK